MKDYMPKLQNWQEIPELTYYCGDGVYEKQISEGWPYFTSIVNRSRDRRLGNWREKKMIQELFPSGLCGEVKLIYKN